MFPLLGLAGTRSHRHSWVRELSHHGTASSPFPQPRLHTAKRRATSNYFLSDAIRSQPSYILTTLISCLLLKLHLAILTCGSQAPVSAGIGSRPCAFRSEAAIYQIHYATALLASHCFAIDFWCIICVRDLVFSLGFRSC